MNASDVAPYIASARENVCDTCVTPRANASETHKNGPTGGTCETHEKNTRNTEEAHVKHMHMTREAHVHDM